MESSVAVWLCPSGITKEFIDVAEPLLDCPHIIGSGSRAGVTRRNFKPGKHIQSHRSTASRLGDRSAPCNLRLGQPAFDLSERGKRRLPRAEALAEADMGGGGI